MNPPIEDQQSRSLTEEHLIDRLVDGELPDTDRRELLQRLENESNGWRRCALAFLEAQVWRQTLASMVAPGAPVPPEVQKTQYRRSHSWRSLVRLTGLAASLAAAFVLGWAYHRGPEVTDIHPRVNQPVVPVTNGPLNPPKQDPVMVATEESSPSKLVEPHASLDPMVKRWEQRGFSVETQQRLVSMETKDGRQLRFPVQEVRIRYVGDRTY